jgi:putative transposase
LIDMGRALRTTDGGLIYHALNRSNARVKIFADDDDYAMFEQVLVEARERTGTRILAWCIMPTHWHLVLWPEHDGELSAFMRYVSLTHTQRWHASYGTAGEGHLYQGRYKSFLIQADEHFLDCCRYVERNPVRAGLVTRAQEWRWSSLWRHANRKGGKLLSPWPVQRPAGWTAYANSPLPEAELEALRTSVARGRPYGGTAWMRGMIERYHLASTVRPIGRPPRDAPLFPLLGGMPAFAESKAG